METLHVERRPHSPPSGPNRRFQPERHRTTRIILACTLSPQGSGWRTLPRRSRGMQAPSSRKISTGYQPAVTGFPPRDSSRSPGSLRAGSREDAPTGDPGRDLRFRDIPADATRPDQLRIDPAGAKRRNRLGPGRSPRADSPRTSESGLNAELSRRHPSRSLRAVYQLRYWRRPGPRIPSPSPARDGRSGPSSGSCCARATCRSSEGPYRTPMAGL